MKKSNWKVRFITGSLGVFLMAALALAEENPYDKAIHAYQKKDFKTTVNYLKEYVEKKPDPYAYYLLGYSLYKMKRHSESVKYFQEAYILDPKISPVSIKKQEK